MTLTELVHGPMCTSLPATDRAILIADELARVAEMEAEIDSLLGQLSDLENADERAEALEKALTDLINAIETSELVTTARVGQLLVIDGNRRAMAPAFADALEAARKLV